LERYTYKHFIFRRGDDSFYEIAPPHVEIVDSPLVWPTAPPVGHARAIHVSKRAEAAYRHVAHSPPAVVRPQVERVYDRDILAEFYQGVQPYSSPKLGFYWRGPIELLDGSKVEIVLIEDSSGGAPMYSLVLRDAPKRLKEVADLLSKQEFSSARGALISAERLCNRLLFKQLGGGRKSEGD
jgi:hypothetical protein